ncbi:MAG: AAA family ATPase [Chloroflexi bacterium]|nr:AAA family ATPase [Chloroflexota bacterium]
MQAAPTLSSIHPSLTSSTALRGRWLWLARAIWVAGAVLALVVLVAAVPVRHEQLLAVCAGSGCVPDQLDPGTYAALNSLGLSTRPYAVYFLILDLSFAVVSIATALIIFIVKSDDWVTLLVSFALITLATVVPSLEEALARAQPVWNTPVAALGGLAVASFFILLYTFPDGRVVARRTRWMILITGVWALAYLLFPVWPINPDEWPVWLQFVATIVFRSGLNQLPEGLRALRTAGLTLMFLIWFGIGLYSQIYRYYHVASPAQRQQTKWVVFGLAATFAGQVLSQLLVLAIPSIREPGLHRLLYSLIGIPLFFTIPLLILPLSLANSILSYRLWDIDTIIYRVVIYGTLTGALGTIYFGSVVLLQSVVRRLTGQTSDFVVAASTLIIASLFQPLRRRLQHSIDRRFYREKVDFRRAITEFSREVRTILELPELLRALVGRVTDLLHISHGAVYLRRADGSFDRAEAHHLPAVAAERLAFDGRTIERLQSGSSVFQPHDKTFPLLVPLIAPQARTGGLPPTSVLVGILALGPRLSGQPYTRGEQPLLIGLADQAGTAIYVAQLIQERQAEASRREEAERRLATHRNSPIGRAEALAQTLVAKPETALMALHDLTQQAGHDRDSASLLEHLPMALRMLDGADTPLIAGLAEGYHFILSSQSAPELLSVGLRALTDSLEQPRAAAMQCAPDQLALYRLCLLAFEADSIAQITELLSTLRDEIDRRVAEPDCQPGGPFSGLIHVLAEIASASAALHAYERVDTSRDKLAYLARAVELLSRADRLARTDLGAADRPIVRRIAERWLGVVTGAMSELQTRAQIVCRLLTRHTWHEEIVSVALNLRNDGRGAAVNLQIGLAPTDEYTVLDEIARIQRLAPGEEAQVEIRVRPRPAAGSDQFRARFVVQYADPRGPDQIEHFADVVYLLTGAGEFQFIPNPYVIGTPLQTGSPLFFGREDIVQFVQASLSAAHRNNLVLIGQRRTGKTSLLKQLPARLGEDYLAVYLDGQTLGLDPGLPNFFLTLATEIAFALEDRGLGVEPPELIQFADSPASAFERQFLPRVREAIGSRHLLIMFDEFEELEGSVRRGNLDPSVFGFLRHLIQHSRDLSVIFCGTHRLEELAADYWNVLFNISLYRHVGFLEQAEALRLIQEPVARYHMQYDDLALEKMWRVTAGHPYFLQLLCHSLVNRHNQTERNYLTVADVNAALDDILASGEAHFVYLWTEAAVDDRLVLTALSRVLPLTGQTTPVQLVDYLAERGVTVERRAVTESLRRLVLRDVLATAADGGNDLGETYRWKLGLLGLWVGKYRSLSRVVDEAKQ